MILSLESGNLVPSISLEPGCSLSLNLDILPCTAIKDKYKYIRADFSLMKIREEISLLSFSFGHLLQKTVSLILSPSFEMYIHPFQIRLAICQLCVVRVFPLHLGTILLKCKSHQEGGESAFIYLQVWGSGAQRKVPNILLQ